ncbi:MAG: hypothetical protein WA061_01665 [Microgenomates group bacterium]
MNKIQVRIKWKNVGFESWEKSPVVFTTRELSEETEKAVIRNLNVWANAAEVLEIRWNYFHSDGMGMGHYVHNDEYLRIQEA